MLTVYFNPPSKCDICHKPITDEFVDGATSNSSSWANMCNDCHASYGRGLGRGIGQRYKLNVQDGKFHKIAG